MDSICKCKKEVYRCQVQTETRWIIKRIKMQILGIQIFDKTSDTNT